MLRGPLIVGKDISLSAVVIEQQSMVYCKESHLVRGVVELKVVITHAKEAEVVIPKNQHWQNTAKIAKLHLMNVFTILTNRRSYPPQPV